MQSAVVAVIDSVRLFDRLTVICWHCVKTTTIMRSSLEDSPVTSFLVVNCAAKFQREHRQQGQQMREG